MNTSHFRKQVLFLCLGWMLATACRQSTPNVAPSPAPIPQASAVANVLPTIRTSETALDFSPSLTAAAQENSKATARGLTMQDGAATAQWIAEPQAVTLAEPAPFLALSARWDSVVTSSTKLTVSVRATTDKQTWSDWQLSSLDGDPRTHTGLFFFPPDAKFVQARIEMARDERQQAPLLKSIHFRFISPGATPAAELNQLQATSVLRRSQWHCAPSAFKSKPQTGQIKHLIVHHTATANDVQDWPAVVRTIWNFHAVTNGWRDLGYHYLIDPNGVIYEGRAGGEKSAGIHFSCANTGTMGIALLGNYLKTAPTEAALQSLEKLLATRCQQFHLDPLGASWHASTGLKLPHIAGHLDANASASGHVCAGTHCPGERLYALLPTVREAVKKLMAEPKL